MREANRRGREEATSEICIAAVFRRRFGETRQRDIGFGWASFEEPRRLVFASREDMTGATDVVRAFLSGSATHRFGRASDAHPRYPSAAAPTDPSATSVPSDTDQNGNVDPDGVATLADKWDETDVAGGGF
jgi:hypothetical protein